MATGAQEPPVEELVPAPVVRAARVALALSAAIFAAHAYFAATFFKSRSGVAVLAALTLALIAAQRLAPARRVKLALALFPSLLLVHALDAVIAYRRPAAATAAARAGRAWDSRPMLDVLKERRALGEDAWPSARPRLLYKKRRRALTIDGREMLPLGGISGVRTILCNESGAWSIYEADEHGFNNPRGVWSRPVDVALVGDSFTQGACVPEPRSLAGKIRERYPATLNLGMLGNGPLLELAGIAEYLGAVRPKKVLWLYFHNDLTDLNFEKTSRFLRRYVEEEAFHVGLVDHQPAIDAALKRAITAIEGEAAWWPRRLAAVGLTRRTTPVFLQDLLMGERSSSAAAALRLEHTLGMAYAGPDPEAPSPTNPPDFALLQRALERGKAMAASWGGTLHFVYLPDFWPPGSKRMMEHPNRAGVLDAARKAGVPIIDVHAEIAKRDDVSKLLYFPASHCNEVGYAALGEAIVAALGN